MRTTRRVTLNLLSLLVLITGARCPLLAGALDGNVSGSAEHAAISGLMARVADWQLEHPSGETGEWSNAVFYVGLLAAHRGLGEPRFLSVVEDIGERLDWRLGTRVRHADDHAIGQAYLELYEIRRDPRMVGPLRATIDQMMVTPTNWRKKHQPVDYWWSDALFMSPPVLARIARLTGEERYLDFMDRLWRESYDLLWNEEQRLFHRDLRFRRRAPQEFWSRGNGWVLAGLALMLPDIPEGHAARELYVETFRAMSRRVAELQPADGLWRSSLLAGPSRAHGEVSGTALFCYALAAGVNDGLLPAEEFRPTIVRAWRALASEVADDGRLGWVQPPGAAPDRITERDSAPYGAGAFLLAGAEMLDLASRTPETDAID
jgi:unsaturated rhamnogalacturonyl hydrolase